MSKDPGNFREYAATLGMFILLMSAIALVFVIALVPAYTGKPVTLPDAVAQFLFGLVTTGVGYLIGKQTTGATTNQQQQIADAAAQKAVDAVAPKT